MRVYIVMHDLKRSDLDGGYHWHHSLIGIYSSIKNALVPVSRIMAKDGSYRNDTNNEYDWTTEDGYERLTIISYDVAME